MAGEETPYTYGNDPPASVEVDPTRRYWRVSPFCSFTTQVPLLPLHLGRDLLQESVTPPGDWVKEEGFIDVFGDGREGVVKWYGGLRLTGVCGVVFAV